MTFNDQAQLKQGKARKTGRTAGGIAAGGGVLAIVIALVGPMLGVDLTGIGQLLGIGTSTGAGEEVSLDECRTGADANENDDCRLIGAQNSLNDFWSDALGRNYVEPALHLFEGGVNTGCGSASSAMGPFYCPSDQTVYIDTSFFGELRLRYNTTAGPLAQMYITAHEWGHHVQNIGGIMKGLDLRATGPASDSVRLELQADCFAGAWVAAASSTTDDRGTQLLKAPTKSEIADALSAAAAVGDDHIMESAGMQVNPEGFSHGSSEQRTQWFARGYDGGFNACDTFGVAGSQL